MTESFNKSIHRLRADLNQLLTTCKQQEVITRHKFVKEVHDLAKWEAPILQYKITTYSRLLTSKQAA